MKTIGIFNKDEKLVLNKNKIRKLGDLIENQNNVEILYNDITDTNHLTNLEKKLNGNDFYESLNFKTFNQNMDFNTNFIFVDHMLCWYSQCCK